MMPETDAVAALQSLLDMDRPCACGRRHVVPTREAILESGAIAQVPEVTRGLGLSGPCLVVADANTRGAAGEAVLEIAADGGLAPSELLLEPERPAQAVEASDEATEQVASALREGARFAVAVGAGTINDVVKLACSREGVPYVAVATAPSMNGYPSAIAAISVAGVKRTLPAEPPAAVLADLDVLCAAPPEMIAAGYADLLSKSCSSADWKMAHLLRGEYFCQEPVSVVEDAEAQCRANAAAIRAREPEAVGLLTAALIQSGISMAMAGSSAPASGGEHLISHYWDMTAPAYGRRHDLHGRQAGVGTLVCAALYENLRERLPSVDLGEVLARRPSFDAVAEESREHFAPVVGEATAGLIVEELRGKYASREEVGDYLRQLLADPEGFWAELDSILRPHAELRAALLAGGAPTTIAELGLSEDELRAAFVHARDIRSRYTVLDLADDLGLLTELCDEVLAESGVLLPDGAASAC